ncbi:MAG: PilZ domain-containing protein [Candidatus Omnitrophica bacterium]|nr:PilZ domain-containing protein [Candidatus Omnitrophota bacterium]
MADAEHRRDPRIPHGFLVRYRRPSESGWSVSPLRDLSSSGARFLGEHTFEVGTDLDCQLMLPLAREPLVLQARVAWVKPGPMNLAEYGVTFQADAPGVQEVIDVAVAHFLRKQRKP